MPHESATDNTMIPTDHSGSDAQILAWLLAMGVDEAHESKPQDRFALSANNKQQKAENSPQKEKAVTPAVNKHVDKSTSPIAAVPTVQISNEEAVKQAISISNQCKDVSELKRAFESFEGCSLKRTATNTVFLTGTTGASLLVIGAAPGANEDRNGEAYQGQTGELLDKMLNAIGYNRDKDAFLSYIVPWRPLGNKNPDPQSLATCLPFTRKLIELTKPKVILLLGNCASQNILENNTIISQLRGKWQEVNFGGHQVAIMPSYHPDYLLKHPRFKRDSWQDLLAVKNKLENISS